MTTLTKQLKNINSAIKTTVISLLKLLTVLIIFAALSGGDSFALERQKYRIIVARPDSNITTQLRVYAENEEEARENVALNGWQILSIEPMDTETTSGNMQLRGAESGGSFSINISKVGEGRIIPEGEIPVAAGDSLEVSFVPGPCEKIGRVIHDGREVSITGPDHTFDISKDGYIVAVFDENGTECADSGILSRNLTEAGALYFELGEFTAELTAENRAMIQSADPEKSYVVIGHTDDVRVIPNKEYADNFQLSVKRAGFMKKHLTDAGISADMIETVGLGPAFPAAPNKEDGQPLNRRAVLYVRTR